MQLTPNNVQGNYYKKGDKHTFPARLGSLFCHFHNLCSALDAKANTPEPEFV